MTVRELAQLAGVSPSAVSLVLNGKKGVSEEKRKEILKLIADYDYKHQQRGENKSRSILFIKYTKHGLLVEENTGFISEVMDGAAEEARNRDCTLTIIRSEGNLEETLKSLNYSELYGLIILGTELDETDYAKVEKISIPYVIVDNNMPNFRCNSVAIDNEENLYQIMEYVAKLGFREVGYFKCFTKIQNLLEREEGFFKAAKHFGLTVSKDAVFEIPVTILGAYEKTQEYLTHGAEIPPCVFVDNDTMAIGVMKALQVANYQIPRDVSVIGFDDIPFAKIYSPTITTMQVNKRQLGVESVQMLLKAIENDSYRGVKTRISGKLKVRESTKE